MRTFEIQTVRGRRVWDSRGRPTVEAEVQLAGGAAGRAIAPAGASTGSGEALDRRDGGTAFGGLDVLQAVAAVEGEIADALRGASVEDQEALDRRLVMLDGTEDKSRLGANACVAVSMAAVWAAAAAAGMPLWRWLSRGEPVRLPAPEIQIFGGGAHAGRRVDIQDFMVTAPAAASFAQACDWIAEVYRSAGLLMAEEGRLRGVADEGGFWPDFDSTEAVLDTLALAIEKAGFRAGEQVAIALDVAASEFGSGGRYRLALEDRVLDSEGMASLIGGWIERYPIVSVEDPLGRGRLAGICFVHGRLREFGPGRRRRSAGDLRRTRGEGGTVGSGQHASHQAESAWNAERGKGRMGRSPKRRIWRHRLGAFGRKRGCHHRAPGRWLGRIGPQGRLLCPL